MISWELVHAACSHRAAVKARATLLSGGMLKTALSASLDAFLLQIKELHTVRLPEGPRCIAPCSRVGVCLSSRSKRGLEPLAAI
jgi:hypothetical protein